MKLAVILLLGLVTTCVAAWTALGFRDGPLGPIRGGPLVRGDLLHTQTVDWAEALDDRAVGEIEIQLVSSGSSRTTGAFERDGELYVPCDLGFLWRRVPSATLRGILRLIWVFKSWHEEALADGRVIVRVAGHRYERYAERVTDPDLLGQLRDHVSSAAGEYFGGLLPLETDPDDIWFFRLEARPPE